MSPIYSPAVLDHFTNPRHVGMMADADAVGQVGGGPMCPDDLVYVWIKVRSGRIAEINHKTMGCPVAISSSSMTCSLALGKTLEEAMAITPAVVIAALDGVPERRTDSVVAPDALRKAIEAYREE